MKEEANMNELTDTMTDNMIRWAEAHIGEPGYASWCLSFIEDALEISNGIEIFGGDCARESAELYADAMRKGVPERGSYVFYDCMCMSDSGPQDWGHCGISLGDGKVIHAWNVVRVDHYLEIEQLEIPAGHHPRYIGWVPLERVLKQKPEDW